MTDHSTPSTSAGGKRTDPYGTQTGTFQLSAADLKRMQKRAAKRAANAAAKTPLDKRLW